MLFDFSSPLTGKLFWTFPELLGKCLLIRNQLALPQISLNFLESEVSTRMWALQRHCRNGSNPQSHREVHSPKPRGLWEWWTRAKGPMQAPIKRERSASSNDAPWENRETLERFDSSTFVPHFAWYLVEAALCFSAGDRAGINCQTCLPPPCHLIIACNTPRCWQCWAIDSWHSLKLLIIFSHKPLSDLSTSLYCLWKKKSSILRFQDYALRGKLAVTLVSALECLCTHTHRQGKRFQIVKQSSRMTILLPTHNGDK